MDKDVMVPYISRGGFPENEQFEFDSGHFHWSSENTTQNGSEHHIDDNPAPLELHLVHWNKGKGKDLNSAMGTNEWNALAVLGIKYDIGKHNKDLEPLFDILKEVHGKGKSITLSNHFKLKSFLPRGTGRFYRYNGSLTTPQCNEVVIWTVFKDREYISEKQLKKLRATMKNIEPTKRDPTNTRPVQPLNGRTVLDIDTRDYDGSCSDFVSSSTHLASTCPPYPDCSSDAVNIHHESQFISSLLALVKLLINTILNF